MAKGSDYFSAQVVKMLYIGDSGSGKTGSLLSLLQAGYKLRIIDYDVGVGTLIQFARAQCPELVDNIEYEVLRDKLKASPRGIVPDGTPKAFNKGLDLLDKWSDGTEPKDWGPEYIMVIDSLTVLSRAAYRWYDAINPSVADKRQIYNLAQQAVLDFLSNLTAKEFNTNVILIGHIRYNDAGTRGWVQSVGQAINEAIPALFNNFFQAEKTGQGEKARRVIRTYPSGPVAVKSEISFKLPKELPLETGMADLFQLLKGEK